MPNPKLETYKSKKTGVIYDYTDADAQSQLTGIKDGTSIDSFADVESALAGKASASDVASRVDWSSYAKTGVHNFLNNTAASGTSATVDFTVNVDKSVKGNGTASGNANFILNNLTSKDLPAGNYVLSTGNPQANLGLVVEKYNGDTWVAVLANSYTVDNIPFTVDWNGYDRLRVALKMESGRTVDNITMYPMIRIATDTNTTYAPYAMTNEELTDALNTRLFLQSESATKTVTLKLSNTNQQILALVFSGGWRAVILLTSRSSQSTAYEDNIFTSDNTKNLGAQYVDGNIQITLPTYTNVNLLSAETFTV